MAIRHVQNSICIHINNRCPPFQKFGTADATPDEKMRECFYKKRFAERERESDIYIKQLNFLLSASFLLPRISSSAWCVRFGIDPLRFLARAQYQLVSLLARAVIFRSCAPIRMGLAASAVRRRILPVSLRNLPFFMILQYQSTTFFH